MKAIEIIYYINQSTKFITDLPFKKGRYLMVFYGLIPQVALMYLRNNGPDGNRLVFAQILHYNFEGSRVRKPGPKQT